MVILSQAQIVFGLKCCFGMSGLLEVFGSLSLLLFSLVGERVQGLVFSWYGEIGW